VSAIVRFEDIQAWRSARRLRQEVYRASRKRAFVVDSALVQQIRRAAISACSNIAEGFDRGGNREFIQFLSLAKGSVAEVKDQLYCAADESYITREEFDSLYGLADETARLIGGFMSYLRNATLAGHKFDAPSRRTDSKLKTQSSKLAPPRCSPAASSPASTSTPAASSKA
jgi:four helix bundle protein